MKEIIPFSDEIKKVLRGTSTDILKEYFDTRNLFQDLNFTKEAKGQVLKFVEMLFQKIEKLEPKRMCDEIKFDLHQIYVMHNSKSLLPVIRELKNIGDHIIEFIEDSKKTYDQAFILFLKDKECFRNHYLIYGDGKNYKRWWNVRTDYVQKDYDISPELVKELFSEVKEHLLSEGMGKYYDIHTKSFGSKEQIVIFYQDLLAEKAEMKSEKVDMILSRPVKKIVFLYDKKRKFVKTFSEDGDVRVKSHRIFAKIIFGKESISSSQPLNRVCKLDKALDQIIQRGEIIFTIPSALNVSKITAVSAVFMNSETVTRISSRKNKQIYSSLRKNVEKFFKLDEESVNTTSIMNFAMSEIEFIVEYSDFFSKKTYRTKRISMNNNNSISNINEEDIDFEILDCLRGAEILEIEKC